MGKNETKKWIKERAKKILDNTIKDYRDELESNFKEKHPNFNFTYINLNNDIDKEDYDLYVLDDIHRYSQVVEDGIYCDFTSVLLEFAGEIMENLGIDDSSETNRDIIEQTALLIKKAIEENPEEMKNKEYSYCILNESIDKEKLEIVYTSKISDELSVAIIKSKSLENNIDSNEDFER